MNDLLIEKLGVSYGKTPVLRRFDLHVRGGELAVVLGPSGCGKSTLLTAISGLITPDDGRIAFGGSCFYSKKERIDIPAEQRNIGFVFQSYALWPHMSVYENIAFPLKARHIPADKIRKSVSEMLDIVHMRGCEKRSPGELSGGEKQRIALARSLVYRPSVLLLDEPLANLDAYLKTSLIGEIQSIQRRLGVTMIYVTHDQNEAFEIADRIVIMKDGQIMQQGTPQEVYNGSENLFVAGFIGKNNIFRPCGRRCPGFLSRFHTEKTVTIRPEDVEIKADGPYRGVVKAALYKGDHIEYTIESDGAELLSCSPDQGGLQKGDAVSFDIRRGHLI